MPSRLFPILRTRALALLLAAVAWITIPTVADAGGGANVVLSQINMERNRAGLRPIRIHSDLQDDAQRHSATMAAQGHASRMPNLNSAAQGWVRISQYEAKGTTVAQVHRAMMGSPQHRRQTLGEYSHAGVAVARDSHGNVYVTVLLMKL